MEPNQNNLTDTTLPEATHVEAADGGAAVADTLSLTELNSLLGKDFKDKATALKAVKDTFSYVGKKVDAANPAPTADPNLASEVNSLKKELFYTANPQYKGYEALISKMGGNPSEVVASAEFKDVFEKAKVADEVSRTKSVVASNSRLGAPKTVTDEALNIANAAGSSTSDVAGVFAKALNEAMGS